MPTFEQEWISPILEVYKKEKITDVYTVILGLNPLGQALCRYMYERNMYETVLIFNAPAFNIWNRYPSDVKPPVIPVQGMISEDIMLIFGDVFIKEYEWVTDMLFYLRGHVPTRFLIALMGHDGPTVGQVISKKGERLLKRMAVPIGRGDFYDGLTAPLMSIGGTAGFDPVVIFQETTPEGEILTQVDDITITRENIEEAIEMLRKGLDFHLASSY